MADVQKFNIEGTDINVKDATARADISTLNTDVGALANRVTTLEGLARLSISYSSQTETITFTTQS